MRQLMKYNKEYDVWVSKDGVVCYEKNGVLRPYATRISSSGYELVSIHGYITKTVHSLVWKTFNDDYKKPYQVDHINDDKLDNRLCNLQLLSAKDNCNKRHRITALSETNKGHFRNTSDFSMKFFEHFNMRSSDDIKLYTREWHHYKKYGVCRWEMGG